MLRTEAQELQRKTKDTHDWFEPLCYLPVLPHVKINFNPKASSPYKYCTKATIKLDGRMVTREQAAAEWEAKKETHICIHIDRRDSAEIMNPAFDGLAANGEEYELRPKKPTWTGSREDVLALLKEKGLL
jgi:hypothetical protein